MRFLAIALKGRMVSMLACVWAVLAVAWLCKADVVYAQDNGTRRFALVIGANYGGVGRTPLRFANKDAGAIANVLFELGGVQDGDVILVEDATKVALETGLLQLHQLLQAATARQQRTEVLVYYSGHSNEEGLLLGNQLFRYKQLKAVLADLKADVRVMVLDSCESGSLLAQKGGQRRPAFLLDAAAKTKGQAIITSASSTEAAQESSRLAGSFFTHYLISGLRGAADANNDGKVTLNEAYYYAYAQTLARTESTRSGPQHPSYDFQLAGTGDLVLTDLHHASATLIFPAPTHGTYFVRNEAGVLIAELTKTPGAPAELALVPGEYRVVRQVGRDLSEARFLLPHNQHLSIKQLAFNYIEGERNATRGDDPSPDAVAEAAETAADAVRQSRINLALWVDEFRFVHTSATFGVLHLYVMGDLVFGGPDATRSDAFAYGFGVGSSWQVGSKAYLAFEGLIDYFTRDMLTRGQVSFGYHLTKELSLFAGIAAVSTSSEQPAQIVFQIDPYRKVDDIAKSWVGSRLGLLYEL